MLQSEKNAVEILDSIIQTKTHEMDVLEALEDETLESHTVDVLDTMDTLEIVQSKVL